VIWAIFAITTTGKYLDPQNISNSFPPDVGDLFSVNRHGPGDRHRWLLDLSVGKLAGLSPWWLHFCNITPGNSLFPNQLLLQPFFSVICGLLVGTLAGVVQGYIIAFQGLPAFIVTLAGMWLFNGLILLVTQGKTIAADQSRVFQYRPGLRPAIWGIVIFVLILVFLGWNVFSGRAGKQKLWL